MNDGKGLGDMQMESNIVTLDPRRKPPRSASSVLAQDLASDLPGGVSLAQDLLAAGQQEWVTAVMEQVKGLLRLAEGWDGFEAGPIRRDVLFFAMALLQSIMQQRTPAPHLTPMSHEGIQLEWHINGIELEIEIEAPGVVFASYVNAPKNVDMTWTLSTDFSELLGPIADLTPSDTIRAA